MTEFEDNLWFTVVREHGDELARTERTARRHRRASRPRLLVGTTTGLAAVAIAAALVFGASTSSPAFAVTRNADGTVTLNLMHPSGIAGANKKLAAMGVRAQIAVQAKVAPQLVCPGGTAPTITFDPASIPSSQELVIAPGQTGVSDAASPKTGPNGSGSTYPAATSGEGNHVVRAYPVGGNIRTDPGAGNHVVRMYCP